MMVLVVIWVSLVSLALGQDAGFPPLQTGCSPNICMMVSCMSAIGCQGRVETHGGFCGCCPLCIKQLSFTVAMHVLTIAALCLLAVSVNCRCAPNICNLVDCMYPIACNGRVDVHGGFCGCCPICVQQLGEGDRCDIRMFAGSTINAECGTGLRCVSGHCRHVKRGAVAGPCAAERDAYNSNQHLLGATKPRCNPDGSYEARQCSGSGCHCVDKEGNNLGYFVNFGKGVMKQNCQCAIEKSDYMKSGLIGMLFYCDSMGNYAANHH